jgi:hypothetical protein
VAESITRSAGTTKRDIDQVSGEDAYETIVGAEGFAESYQLSAISYQLSAISYQLSAISYQLSAISYQLSATSHQPPATSHQPPATRYQVSGISYQSFAFRGPRERWHLRVTMEDCGQLPPGVVFGADVRPDDFADSQQPIAESLIADS